VGLHGSLYCIRFYIYTVPVTSRRKVLQSYYSTLMGHVRVLNLHNIDVIGLCLQLSSFKDFCCFRSIFAVICGPEKLTFMSGYVPPKFATAL
jgi:hypothetical protein